MAAIMNPFGLSNNKINSVTTWINININNRGNGMFRWSKKDGTSTSTVRTTGTQTTSSNEQRDQHHEARRVAGSQVTITNGERQRSDDESETSPPTTTSFASPLFGSGGGRSGGGGCADMNRISVKRSVAILKEQMELYYSWKANHIRNTNNGNDESTNSIDFEENDLSNARDDHDQTSIQQQQEQQQEHQQNQTQPIPPPMPSPNLFNRSNSNSRIINERRRSRTLSEGITRRSRGNSVTDFFSCVGDDDRGFQLKNTMTSANFNDVLLLELATSNTTDTRNESNVDNVQQQSPQILAQDLVREVKLVRGREVLNRLHSMSGSSNSRDGILIPCGQDNGDDRIIGSICLVVRRPGCMFCRKQALLLSLVSILYPDIVDGFTIWGIVKESFIGVDEYGLHEFSNNFFFGPAQMSSTLSSSSSPSPSSPSSLVSSATTASNTTVPQSPGSISSPQQQRLDQEHYPFPIFADKSYTFYQALGDRKISFNQLLTWNQSNNLLKAVLCEIWQNWKDGSDNNTSGITNGSNKGEGLIQGGLIVFDGYTNKPIYVYEEETGFDLPVVALACALDTIRQRRRQR